MSEHEAGRELDALIEERIFGNPVDHEFEEPIVKARRDRYDEWGVLPAYSTEGAAALEIVWHLAGQGYHFACDNRCEEFGPWWAEFATADYEGGGQAPAETFPLAICRAALKAVGAA